MNPSEIAQQQLSRLAEMKRKRRRVGKVEPVAKSTAKTRKSEVDSEPPPSPPTITVEDEAIEEPPVDSYTIEWEDDEETPIVVQEKAVVPDTPKIVVKQMIWDPDTKEVIATKSGKSPVSAAKKKRSEVDKLLGDEGVLVIMREQQIAIDEQGMLVNMEKSCKTRHQKMRQEEPEKTPNDWNICSMIVSRRSSVSSVESVKTPMGDLLDGPKDSPNIFRSMKIKINKTLLDNFDAIANSPEEEENNNTVISPSTRRLGKRPVRPARRSNGNISALAVKNAKKSSPPPPPPAKVSPVVAVKEEPSNVVQVKISIQGGKGRAGTFFSSSVVEKIIDDLDKQLKNQSCKMVLLGPIKFPAEDPPSLDSADERAQYRILKYLAEYSKPIVTAVQGHVEGVGVTMLPLFDLVFAAKYGTEFSCSKDPLPGCSLLTMDCSKADKNRVSELLFLDESVTSTQAVQMGLVTQEVSSKGEHEFNTKVMKICNEIVSNGRTERMRKLRKLWINQHLGSIISNLSKESEMGTTD